MEFDTYDSDVTAPDVYGDWRLFATAVSVDAGDRCSIAKVPSRFGRPVRR